METKKCGWLPDPCKKDDIVYKDCIIHQRRRDIFIVERPEDGLREDMSDFGTLDDAIDYIDECA